MTDDNPKRPRGDDETAPVKTSTQPLDALASMRSIVASLRKSILSGESKTPVKVIDLRRGDPWEGPQGLVALPSRLSWEEQVQLTTYCVDEATNAKYSNLVTSGKTPKDKLKELRWVTLGHNYDWTNRTYREGWITDPIPPRLGDLCKAVVEEAGFGSYDPTASIVNYYSSDSRMGPHRDDAELTMSAPIVSISLGLSAVFCIETNPPPLDVRNPSNEYETGVLALLVRSGDVIIMGGASRTALHSCCCVLPDSFEFNSDDTSPSSPPPHILEFLKTRRININVRQVEGDPASGETWAATRVQQPANEHVLL